MTGNTLEFLARHRQTPLVADFRLVLATTHSEQKEIFEAFGESCAPVEEFDDCYGFARTFHAVVNGEVKYCGLIALNITASGKGVSKIQVEEHIMRTLVHESAHIVQHLRNSLTTEQVGLGVEAEAYMAENIFVEAWRQYKLKVSALSGKRRNKKPLNPA